MIFYGRRGKTAFYRTDLAKEALRYYPKTEGVTQTMREENGVTLSRIRIRTKEAAEKLEKPVGTYLSIEADEIGRQSDTMISMLSGAITELLPRGNGDVLVVGLGNRAITPDALGARTVDRLYVTRHIGRFVPGLAPEGLRNVSAIAPGVLGITGMETLEIVKGLCEMMHPAAVLLVDALVSERSSRIADTVQVSDTGLLPGAGVGNRQKGLDRESLGVPVLALGVPTVVRAATIAKEAVRLLENETGVGRDGGALSELAGGLVEQALGELIVTPKDIDKLIDDAAGRLSEGINRALLGENYGEIASLMRT